MKNAWKVIIKAEKESGDYLEIKYIGEDNEKLSSLLKRISEKQETLESPL